MIAKETIPELTKGEFQKLLDETENKGILIVVDFFADWCMPCVMMAPILDSVAEKYAKKKIKFAKINIEEAQELASEFKISSIPCFVFIKNKKEADRITGSCSEEDIEDKIKKLIY